MYVTYRQKEEDKNRRLTSAVTRSTGVSFTGWPFEERAPRIHWMDDRSRLNDKEHLSQYRVVLYGCSHLSARRDARRL